YCAGNVPYASYCSFSTASISLYTARDSMRQPINCWRWARVGYRRYSNVRMLQLCYIRAQTVKHGPVRTTQRSSPCLKVGALSRFLWRTMRSYDANCQRGRVSMRTMRIEDLRPDDEPTIRQVAALLVAGFAEHWPGSWPDMESALA